jgi:protein-S-isoprenylcysteine O-methyltransferase Ste14
MKAKSSEFLEALLGTLFFLFILVPIFLIWIPRKILLSPYQIFFFDFGKIRYLGLVPIILGVAIYVACSGSFVFIGKGTPIPFTPTKKLITTGFYRFVRNPIYLAGVFVLTGEAFLLQSIGIFIYCLVMFGIFNIHATMEERFLADKFGAEYEQYRNSVPRWIPRFKPYRDTYS